jgi:hypothetical protein
MDLEEMGLTEIPETESQKQKLIDSLRELDIDFEIGKDSKDKGLSRFRVLWTYNCLPNSR